MCNIRSYLIPVILLLYWSNYITLVNCDYTLKFWERDTKISARKAINHTVNDIKSKPNLIHKRNATAGKQNKHSKQHVLKHAPDQGTKREAQHKPESRARNKINRSLLRSTRLTPMYLMQQPNQTTEKPKGEPQGTEDTLPKTLSPYFIYRQMKNILCTFRCANTTLEIVGHTAAYNDIVIMKISEKKQDASFRARESKYVDEQPDKKIVFIVHGLTIMGLDKLHCLNHEEEFAKLVGYYMEHLDKFDIFLMPLANPDGYGSRRTLWNKNMSPQDACPGVCLDRNFDVAWDGNKTISSCSQLYPGPSPFSEPETTAIRDILHQYNHKIIAYIHVHAGSYDSTNYKGEAILYPKGYTESQSDDDKYLDLRGEVDEAMKNATFQVASVTVDTLYSWYGKISGSSVDYASTVFGIPYALEFVMQIYPPPEDNKTEGLNEIALREIWKRMIDVVFHNFWKSTQVVEEE